MSIQCLRVRNQDDCLWLMGRLIWRKRNFLPISPMWLSVDPQLRAASQYGARCFQIKRPKKKSIENAQSTATEFL